jgi:hypothetical protein
MARGKIKGDFIEIELDGPVVPCTTPDCRENFLDYSMPLHSTIPIKVDGVLTAEEMERMIKGEE